MDDYLDELLDAQFQRRQHRKLMSLPVGNPDEPEDEGDGDEDSN